MKHSFTNTYNRLFKTTILFLLFYPVINSQAQVIKGIITDKDSGETLPGVTIIVKDTDKGTSSDFDGNYEIALPQGTHTIIASYLSYQTMEITDIDIKKGETVVINIPMMEDTKLLGEVVVVGLASLSSEVALLNSMRNSTSISSGLSAQQIARNQDRDASEVIKRIPGISVIDDKFIIARGLAQRYNNVWINNTSAPSSEADTRSFSFDIIPGSQIENITIIKSPQPELPADFSGGFIKVNTKSIPNNNSVQLSYGIGINTQTQFHDFKYNKGSGTDFLGFDNGKRELAGFVPARVDATNAEQVSTVTQKGFNNDWSIKTRKPIPDQRLSLVINRRYSTESSKIWGLTAALNYSYSHKTYTDMENSRYGIYNIAEDKPTYLYKYTDNQYNIDVKVGALANLVFMPDEKHKFEFRNMFNQLGKNRYTEREGYQYISALYIQNKAEYIYSSRTTYSGQFAGNHDFSYKDNLDWVLGFSYANKNEPDRRIINWEENGFAGDLHYGEIQIDQNEISRDFVKLNEYIYSFGANYKHNFETGTSLKPQLKAGSYLEYKDRDYKNRLFYYRWNTANMPEDFSYRNVINEILIQENFAADKLYIYEDTDNRNSYSGANTLLAGYAAVNLPVDRFNIYAGIRLEHNKMSLESYTKIKEYDTRTKDYTYTDLFPSANISYNIDKDNLVRLAYGRSVNRQEFREVSSSVYTDFSLFSDIKGNPDLKPAYINNFDIRYEFYPGTGEIVSLALFYKNFKNPIEWTYRDAGGSYTYTFENANSADNYGIEIDIKKKLDFIGMYNFSLSLNAALIDSKVKFDKNSMEHDRPMQGQSPYLVNAGLFYQHDKWELNTGLLYNIIGKRIVGIGRVDTSEGSTINNDIPDMYEMPRHAIDLTICKKWSDKFEISASVKDILAQSVEFKQFPKFEDSEGKTYKREQTTRKYKPGRNILISAKYTF